MGDPTDFGERAITAATNLLNQGKAVAKREARVLRLQAQISRLRSHRQRILVEMGEKVYDLFQRELVKNADLRMMCQQIRTIDSDVALRREEIEQLRKPESPVEMGIEPEPPGDDYDNEIIRD